MINTACLCVCHMLARRQRVDTADSQSVVRHIRYALMHTWLQFSVTMKCDNLKWFAALRLIPYLCVCIWRERESE